MNGGEHTGERRPEGSREVLGELDPTLDELRARLDELQRHVERIGREEPKPTPSPTGEHLDLALGPIPGLVELRLLEEGIAGLKEVAGVQVRWFGRRWARLDVEMAGSVELAAALPALGRPMDQETEADGLLVARFTDVGPPEPLPAEAMPPVRSSDLGRIDRTVAQRLPEAVCRHFRMVPVRFVGATMTLAVADPADRLAQDVAAALTGGVVSAVPAAEDHVAEVIDAAFGAGGEQRGGGPEESREETQRIADELGIPTIDLEGIEPAGEALAAIPSELQRGIPCLPLEVDDAVLYVAVSAPFSREDAERVGGHTGGRRLRTFLAPAEDLKALIRRVRAEAPTALRSPPPTAFPGKTRRRRRRLVAVPLAVWALLRAPVPIGVALLVVAVLVYLYLSV